MNNFILSVIGIWLITFRRLIMLSWLDFIRILTHILLLLQLLKFKFIIILIILRFDFIFMVTLLLFLLLIVLFILLLVLKVLLLQLLYCVPFLSTLLGLLLVCIIHRLLWLLLNVVEALSVFRFFWCHAVGLIVFFLLVLVLFIFHCSFLRKLQLF